MMRILKGLIKLILIVTPLVVIGLGAGMLWLSRSQAPQSGEAAIEGLGAEVTIARDANGVPHITARTRGESPPSRPSFRPTSSSLPKL